LNTAEAQDKQAAHSCAVVISMVAHMLALDGIYAANVDGNPQFRVLPAPENRDIERLAAVLAERMRDF